MRTSYPGSVLNAGSAVAQYQSVAFASLPAAASSAGLIYRVSDIGNSLWMSNGTIWKPVGGIAILAASAVQVTAPADDTNENVLATITVPANCMGPNGGLEAIFATTGTSSANNKTTRVRFSGAAGTSFSSVNGTTTPTVTSAIIQNRNAANSQVGSSQSGGATVITASVDTTAATTLVITGQKATGSETMTLERYIVRLIVA